MPDLNHKFNAGKMNKDLDERLVPNGEYRDALNAQVSTSEGSDMGSLQNLLGNLNISSEFFVNQKGQPIDSSTLESYGFYCVGSIADEKNDKLYWLISGIGIDFIAEYNYKTKQVSPIIVDIFQANLLPGDKDRVLHFDKSYLITGINIIEETLFWTDNNTEPKKINIPEIKIGTYNFVTHTDFFVPNPDKTSPILHVSVGPIKHEHITVVKKGPQIAPKLEMKNTTRDDVTGSDPMIGEIQTTINNNLLSWFDASTGLMSSDPQIITFSSAPDFKVGDKLVIESIQPSTGVLKKSKVIVQIESITGYAVTNGVNQLTCTIRILSYDQRLDLDNTEFNVYLLQEKGLFNFRFPRFACRYKYKDGEYSAFSPFTEVAFLPGRFDYLPKEGYNLAMVNTVRALGVCNFVDERSIPDDVISIDILYKESDSPNVYSIKTVERVAIDQGPPVIYDSWNGISPTKLRDTTLTVPQKTYGYVDIEAEMIHSILPSNQLLRGWDNVPRKALAQEVIGNRLVYANYLQNYNMSSSYHQNPSALSSTLRSSKNIEVDLKLDAISSKIYGSNSDVPEQVYTGKAYSYRPAKTVKSLRTYQLGVVYIDEFGRETPVFSESRTSSNTKYVEKISAPQQTKLEGQVFSAKPDFAKAFKFLVKETSSEYYNIAMDRWYPAEDGNIWLSFPSSDRSKVDLETFLILKKSHDGSIPITDLARYKILDIENEAPTFVKTRRTATRKIGASGDTVSGLSVLMAGNLSDTNWPYIGGTYVQILTAEITSMIALWDNEGADSTEKQFRLVSTEGASNWYDVKNWEVSANPQYTNIFSAKEFGVDMTITTPFGAPISAAEPAHTGTFVEFIKKEQKDLPEFEGRFFVKILKDATLQEHIIGYTGIQSTYTSINQFQVQYINPTEANCVPGGIYDPSSPTGFESWYGYGAGTLGPELGKISIDDDNEVTTMHPPTCGDGDGHRYWLHAANTEYAGSSSSGWFIDKVEAFRPYSYNRLFYYRPGDPFGWGPPSAFQPRIPEYLRDDITHGLNNWGAPATITGAPGPGQYGLKDPAISLYETGAAMPFGSSYIDVGWNVANNQFAAAHGISYPTDNHINYNGRRERQLQLIGDCTNYFSGDTPQGLSDGSGGYLGFADVASPFSVSQGMSYLRYDADLGGGKPFTNGKILPAVGCPGVDAAGSMINGSVTDSDGSSIITLSFAGIGGTNIQGRGNTYGMNWNNDTELLVSWWEDVTPDEFVNHVLFVNQITTPGVIWRWKEDPDQVIYQTMDLPSSATTIGGKSVSTTEWDHNQYDQAEWAPNLDPGVGLYNYTKIHDYVTWHWMEGYQTDLNSPTYAWFRAFTAMANWATQGINNYNKYDSPAGGYYYGVPNYVAETTGYPRMNSIILGTYADTTTAGVDRSPNRYPMFTTDWGSSQEPFNVGAAMNRRRRFFIRAKVVPGLTLRSSGTVTTGNEGIGGVGPHFYSPTNDSTLPAHYSYEGSVLDTTTTPALPNTPAPGIRPDGMYTGHDQPLGDWKLYHYNLSTPAFQTYEKIPGLKMTDGVAGVSHSGNALGDGPAPGSVTWQILEPYASDGVDEGYFSQNPGVWETEPKDDLGLEIYHEVGQIYPTELDESNIEQFFGPIHSGNPNTDPSFLLKNSKVTCWVPPGHPIVSTGNFSLDTKGSWDTTLTPPAPTDPNGDIDIRVHTVTVTGGKVHVWLMDINGKPLKPSNTVPGVSIPPEGSILKFTRADGSATEILVKGTPSSGQFIILHAYEVETDAHNYKVTLPWFNAYSFGNGVESNRIRDDYNQVTIDKGPKVSAVLEEPYAEEHRSSGFIYSGIYNSMSGVNNLNQFIQAEKITKDLNPSYGSIQKLFARDTDLVTFCEDKVFKVLANKDALYNADGTLNLTATENVLGQTTPFAGDHGISTNPESFAADAYRLYFTDRTRGSVLRLSQDGMTPISSYGMTDWFIDNLPNANRIMGSFDDRKKEYNISLSYYDYTVYPVKILGVMQPSGPSLPGQSLPTVPIPSTTLEVKSWIASNFEVGDDIAGPGIPIGAIVVAKSNQGAGIWHIQISQLPTNQDIATLGDYICGDVNCLDLWWNTRLLSSTETSNEKTLSYSDMVKGWPSFKSFHYENALSLNNDYFTFKGGQLYQHHINNTHNMFYEEQYDSSVEVLFNEESGSVKSFQTIDYEGTQSKITSDGGLSETSHSGEYWDNYDKLGWYVDHMYTDLQEAEPAEFKNKEGKWFSAVQGVTTEWLDDGKAGNIDTREFSYQGIDEAGEITVLEGGYTSWDCRPAQQYESGCCTYIDSDGNVLDKPLHSQTFDMAGGNLWHGQSFIKFMFDNPSLLFNNYNYEITNVINSWGALVSASAVYGVCNSDGGGVTDPSAYPNSPTSFLVNDQIYINWVAETDDYYTATLNNGANTIHSIDVTNINYLVQWCIDHIDSTAFFLGMDYNTWSHAIETGSGFMYAGVFVNVLAGPCSLMQGSSSGSSHICVEVEGLGGAYPDEALCLADADSACNTDCDVPNQVTAHSNDDVSNDCYSETAIPNGSAAVEVYLAGDATSWTVEYFDATTGVSVLVDPQTYTQNGFSTFSILPAGEYNAVVTDNLECPETVTFIIACTETPFPCAEINPHTFTLTNVQNPQWIGNRCWEPGDPNISTMSGSFHLTNMALVIPASSWNYDLYLVTGGSSILIDSQTNLSPQSTIVVDGLQEGNYQYVITDSEGCPYPPESFLLTCPSSGCNPPLLGRSSDDKTDSTSDDGCITDNSDGTHTLQGVLSTGGSPSYYVTYYEYDNSLYSSFPGINLANQIQSTTGPFSSLSPAPIASITGLSASNISGKNYVVLVGDTPIFDCMTPWEFTIECDPKGTPVVCPPDSINIPVVTHAWVDAVSLDCKNPLGAIYTSLGSHVLQTVTLQLGALGFTVQYFNTQGFNSGTSATQSSNWIDMTGTANIQGFSPGSTMIQANGSTGLTPGYYACEVIDTLGCTTVAFFKIKCSDSGVVVDPTFNCNDPINGPCGQDSTGSAVNGTTIFANQGTCFASSCYRSLCTGVPWVGCCDTTTQPPWNGLGYNGPNQGLICLNDPCCDCCGPAPHQNGAHQDCQGTFAGSCGSQSSCFTENDLVEMFDGTMKAISKIKVGDEVRSSKNGKIVKGVVTETLIHSFNDVEEVVIINNITAEPYHPVYIDGKWIPIKELGEVTYQFIDNWYNLEIDGNIDDSEHNYIIGGLIASGLGDNERLNNKYQRQPKEIFNL